MRSNNNQQAPILSVSELNQYAKGVLEMHVGKVWVSGEVSNIARPASGHWYFTLKDQTAQIRCAMFRNKNSFVRCKVDNGQQILLQGSVSIYPGRGDYQLIADYIEESGVGALQRQFEQLKAKLANEGLFDPKHKKKLPSHAKHIALITSATGAAVHDVLSVLNERFPLLQVTVIAATVQGDNAVAELCRALHLAEHWNNTEVDEFDAVIIGRGGGSIEDLWSFNEEAVARAIFQCPIPIISAVGHEIDTTIADFVADVRAPTPSAAAELISPDQQHIFQQLDNIEQQLQQRMRNTLTYSQQRLHSLEAALRHPGERLHLMQQQFKQLQQQLEYRQAQQLSDKKHQLLQLQQRLINNNPKTKLTQYTTDLQNLQQQLHAAIQAKLKNSQNALAQHSQILDTVSPLATLQRGYSITSEKNKILRKTSDTQVGATITTQLAEGKLECEVKAIV